MCNEGALLHLRNAYDLNPNDVSIRLALGSAYMDQPRYFEVIKLLDTVDASGLPAKQREAFYQTRGEARQKPGDTEGAFEDFGQLVKLRPQDSRIQYLYGTMALSIEQTDTGIAALRQASQLAPNDSDIKQAYAQALIKKGRTTRDRASKMDTYLEEELKELEIGGGPHAWNQ